MGKYDQSPLRKVRARIEHQCNECGLTIRKGEYYYKQDRFLQFLHGPPKEFCSKCYQEHGAKLLERKRRRTRKSKSSKLDNYLES